MTILSIAALPVALLVSAWSLLAPFLQPDAREGREGLRSYGRSEWSDAVDRFGQAREAHPDARYDFDLGAAAYRAKDFPAASNAFGAADRSADLPVGAANFNLGNARYKAGDLEGALGAYRAALGANPADEDARHNYELALRKLQAAQQQNKDQNQKQKQKGEQEQKPQSQDSKGSKENPDSTQAKQGEQGKQQDKDTPREQEQTPKQEAGGEKQQPAEPARMLSPEQAAQLLNQVTPEERELLQARLKSARRRPAEKDW